MSTVSNFKAEVEKAVLNAKQARNELEEMNAAYKEQVQALEAEREETQDTCSTLLKHKKLLADEVLRLRTDYRVSFEELARYQQVLMKIKAYFDALPPNH